MRRAILVGAAGACVAPFAAIAHDLPGSAPISGFELPQPKPLQPFTLRTGERDTFTDRDLRGRWSLVFFGFTSCPDVCPATMLEVREVRERLASSKDAVPMRVLFVSIDPARDTPARLADYASRFGPGVIAATSTEAGVRAFADQFRVKYEVSTPRAKLAAGYLFDHTASVSLVGPDARLYAVFTLPLRIREVAADVQRIHARHRAEVCPSVQGDRESRSCATRVV